MKLDDFFGMDLSSRVFVLEHYADLLGLHDRLEAHPMVRDFAAGRITGGMTVVYMLKRLLILRHLQPLLAANLLHYDGYFYTKEVATASTHDRRYAAEDKLVTYALIIATGKSEDQLQAERFRPTARALREWAPSSRFPRLKNLLMESNPRVIEAHQGLFTMEEAGHLWWKRLQRWWSA